MRRAKRFAATVVSVALSVSVIAGCGNGKASVNPSATHQPQAAGAMVDAGTLPSLAGLSENVAAHYRFIKGHQEHAGRIPCYCGCGSLGHRDLKECFITANGGYERHGASCGVCQAEAQDLRDMLAQGMAIDEIRATIDANYSALGTPTDTP
jgi:hypothetical protein